MPTLSSTPSRSPSRKSSRMLKKTLSSHVPARMSERQEELDAETLTRKDPLRKDEMGNPTVFSPKDTKSMMKSSSETQSNSPKFSLEFCISNSPQNS
jgi:hypothetical protein